MTPYAIAPKKAQPLKHIELGKTLVSKGLYNDAFDHFKKSIEANTDCAIDILIYLYKQESNKHHPIDIQLISAKVYIQINAYQEAFDIFNDILEEFPDNEATYEALAKLMVKKPLRSKIKQCFEFAVANNIYFPVIISVLPKLYLEEKNYSRAIDFYHTLISMTPRETSYYKVLSELYFRKRDYESASQILHDLLDIAPSKSEELIEPIKQIIQKIPRHPVIRMLYSTVLFRAFKPIEACKELATLVLHHPNKRKAAIAVLKNQNEAFPQTPDLLHLLAKLMIESELYTESLKYIQLMINLSPTHSDSCLLLMQKIIKLYPNHLLALELIGTVYFQQENNLQALHYFHQCINACETAFEFSFIDNIKAMQQNITDPAYPLATLLLAKTHIKAKAWDEALAHIDLLIGTSEETEGVLLKVTILNQQRNSLQALPIIESLLSKHPYHWNVHSEMQATLLAHYANQRDDLSKNSDGSHTLLALGSTHLMMTNTKAAIDALQQIAPSSEDYTNAQRMLARCFFEQSRFDLSNQMFARMIKQTNDPQVLKECHYWKGLSDLLLSNDSQALAAFETIATYDQHYLHTESVLKKLRANQFLNHGGFVLVGAQTFLQSPKKIQLAIRKNHFSSQRKKHHEFEVIGFAQSYNDEGCKQIIKQQCRAGEESFKLAIQMDPKFHIPYVNYALLHAIENNSNAGLELLSQAEAITTSCPFLFYAKALCFIQKKDPESAMRCIHQSIKLSPKEGIFYLSLGDLFYQQRQVEMAITYWKKAAQNIEYYHWIQQRYRAKHFNAISVDYWVSPEMLSLS
ncbi:MAG: hypothetical protein ISQ13_04425 [Candidatus Margulisbacteria bacterium]|nr:hypothetical protein [Candidatus Margulisiibacteriota bacterium]